MSSMRVSHISVLVVFITLGLPGLSAQTTYSNSTRPEPQLGQQAVSLILSLYALDPTAKVDKTGAALPVNGSWSVGKQKPAACPVDAQPCLEVFYRVPEDEVTCEWVVKLAEAGGSGNVLSENAEAQRYLVRKIPDKEGASLIADRKMPPYPAIAAAAHVGGQVVLQAVVTDGKLTSLSVISGPEMLRAAALDAARHWSFKPLLVGDQTVRYQLLLTFVFRTMGTNSASSVRATP